MPFYILFAHQGHEVMWGHLWSRTSAVAAGLSVDVHHLAPFLRFALKNGSKLELLEVFLVIPDKGLS